MDAPRGQAQGFGGRAATPYAGRLAHGHHPTPIVAAEDHAGSDTGLRDELIGWAKEDQQARKVATGLLAKDAGKALQSVMAVDATNLIRLRDTVAKHGVPSRRMIGRRGMEAFWVLAQHADGDTALQDRILTALSVDNEGSAQDQIALLTDRVLISRRLAQRFGSQFHIADGVFVPDSIEDESNLEARRAAVGLMPLADYKCVLQASYGG